MRAKEARDAKHTIDIQLILEELTGKTSSEHSPLFFNGPFPASFQFIFILFKPTLGTI